MSHGDTKGNESPLPTSPPFSKGGEGGFSGKGGPGGFSSETTGRGSTEEEDVIPPEEQEKFSLDKKRFIWPVEGKIVSRFGIQQNGMFFNGIMITAGKEAPVVAAASGTVIFSAPLKDYGETIIVKHEDNFATVYANLGQRLVKRDDHIKKGDKIAFLNRAAPEGAPAVHFEIRQNNKARNPLFFLP